MARTSHKGTFKPRHPDKYVGNLKKITFRSSWEHSFMQFLDNNPNVVRWGSEPFPIPYIKPTDQKIHNYYPDFWVEYVTKENQVLQEIIEIKPLAQTQAPKLAGKKKKQQIYEAITYAVNAAKWKAAQEFCTKYNMKFRIMSENQMFK